MPEIDTMNFNEEKLLCAENLIRLISVRDELPFKPSLSSIIRWTQKGIYGVKLETVRISNHVFTSKQAVRRFLVNQEIAQRRMKGGL